MERRQYKRVNFSEESRPQAFFVLPGTDRILTAIVVSLGFGGLSLRMTRRDSLLHAGDHLILKQIKSPPELQFLSNIGIKLLWSHRDEGSGDILLGCNFLNIPQAIKEQIRQFTDSCHTPIKA